MTKFFFQCALHDTYSGHWEGFTTRQRSHCGSNNFFIWIGRSKIWIRSKSQCKPVSKSKVSSKPLHLDAIKPFIDRMPSVQYLVRKYAAKLWRYGKGQEILSAYWKTTGWNPRMNLKRQFKCEVWRSTSRTKVDGLHTWVEERTCRWPASGVL